jgi:hypothetical protein
MTPHGRARVHEGSCVHCRDGQGQENQAKTGSGATGWDGPFSSVVEAAAFMEHAFPRFKDKGKPYCIPKVA